MYKIFSSSGSGWATSLFVSISNAQGHYQPPYLFTCLKYHSLSTLPPQGSLIIEEKGALEIVTVRWCLVAWQQHLSSPSFEVTAKSQDRSRRAEDHKAFVEITHIFLQS